MSFLVLFFIACYLYTYSDDTPRTVRRFLFGKVFDPFFENSDLTWNLIHNYIIPHQQGNFIISRSIDKYPFITIYHVLDDDKNKSNSGSLQYYTVMFIVISRK